MTPNDLEQRLPRSTDVEIPTSGAGISCSLKIAHYHSLAVKLLGLLVEWSALLDNCETLDVQSLAGLLDCCDPGAKNSLGTGACLLAHNLASRVLLEGSCSVARLGLGDLASEDMTPGELGGDWLLLHGLHCLHGSHCLHCLHCLHSFGHCRRLFVLEGSAES